MLQPLPSRRITRLLGSLIASTCVALGTASANEIELSPCRIDAGVAQTTAKAECGSFNVPENPAEPDGKQIALRIAVIPALAVEPLPDPLVFFAGGPGQGAVDSYLSMRSAFSAIRRKRDILLVDQRGTGESNQLPCNAVTDAQPADYNLELAVAETTRCLDELPGDPRFYTTSVAVDDLDRVRAAMGYDTLNLWGGSYGTRVALHYLKQYPEHVRSVIIDGVIAADQLLGPDLGIAAEKSLQALFARCAEDASCADTHGDLDAKFRGLMQSLEAEPVTVQLPHPRTGEMIDQHLSDGELMGIVRLASYQPLMRALLPIMLTEASEGRYTMMAANAAMLNESFPDLLAMGMHNAVVCSEDAPFFDDGYLAAEREASYMGEFQYQYLKATCEVWPAGTVHDGFNDPVESDKPVLLLSGEFDPVTPPGNAERAMQTLTSAKHIVAPQQGHIISSLGCVPDLLGQFVAEADVSNLDSTCVERLRGMPIFTSPTGPTP